MDVFFEKLYEDRVPGHLSAEQFQTLSAGYTEERGTLAADTPAKETAIQKLRETVSGAEGVIARAKRCTGITELIPELLRLLIRKIVAHEKSVKYSRRSEQTEKIHYSDIGYIGGAAQQDMESPRQELSA